MLSEYRNEEYRRHLSEQRKIYMENIFHATTTHAIDTMTANRNKFLTNASDMSTTHIVQRDAIKDTIVSNMNKVYKQMMSLYDDVKSNSQPTERVKVYKELMEQERIYHENVKIIKEKTDSVEKEISQLKDELSTLSMEHKTVLTKMNDEKQNLTDNFRKLTVDFEQSLKKDKEMLKFLVVESEKTLTVKWLMPRCSSKFFNFYFFDPRTYDRYSKTAKTFSMSHNCVKNSKLRKKLFNHGTIEFSK